MKKEIKAPSKAQLKQFTKMGSLGINFQDCHYILGISRSFFFKRSSDYPEIKDAYRNGKTNLLSNLTEATYRRAMDDKRADASTNARFLIERLDKELEAEALNPADGFDSGDQVKRDIEISAQILLELVGGTTSPKALEEPANDPEH